MILALQRSVGNLAVSRVLAEERYADDSGPAAQAELIEAAMSSPSRPLAGPMRAELESYYQNDFSVARIHDNPIAQRATTAMGAAAMTVGTHVFLGAGAAARKDIFGHEFGHVSENLNGVTETGNDNGAGVTVTDPNQGSERTAAADGAAFAAGKKTAPSVAVQRAAAPDAGRLVQRATPVGTLPVQRMASEEEESEEEEEYSEGEYEEEGEYSEGEEYEEEGEYEGEGEYEEEESEGEHAAAHGSYYADDVPMQDALEESDDDVSMQDAPAQQELTEVETAEVQAGEIEKLLTKCTCQGAMNQFGRFSKKSKLRARRSFKGQRSEQIARHISIRVMNAVRYFEADSGSQTNRTENEVQCTMVNRDRFIISTNRNRSVHLLHERHHIANNPESDEGAAPPSDADWFRNLLLHERPDAARGTGHSAKEEARRNRRARGKLSQVYAGTRRYPEELSLENVPAARALRDAHTVRFAWTNSPDLETLLTDPSGAGSVIFLRDARYNQDSMNDMHAEQKSVLAMKNAGVQEKGIDVVQRGRKPPCAACLTLLKMFKRGALGQVSYNRHQGPFFRNAAKDIALRQPEGLVNPMGSASHPMADMINEAGRTNFAAVSTVTRTRKIKAHRGIKDKNRYSFRGNDRKELDVHESGSDTEFDGRDPNVRIPPYFAGSGTAADASSKKKGKGRAKDEKLPPVSRPRELKDLPQDLETVIDEAIANAPDKASERTSSGPDGRLPPSVYRVIIEIVDANRKGIQAQILRYLNENYGEYMGGTISPAGLSQRLSKERERLGLATKDKGKGKGKGKGKK